MNGAFANFTGGKARRWWSGGVDEGGGGDGGGNSCSGSGMVQSVTAGVTALDLMDASSSSSAAPALAVRVDCGFRPLSTPSSLLQSTRHLFHVSNLSILWTSPLGTGSRGLFP